MPSKPLLYFVILLLHAALIASPAAAEKKYKGHGGGGHGAGHGYRGTHTELSVSPFGVNIGVVGDHFGFGWGVPFAAYPPYGDIRPFAFEPEPYGRFDPLVGPPGGPPVIAPLHAVPYQRPPEPWLRDGPRPETTIPTNPGAVPFQAEAERVFRAGRFDLALPAVRHAIAEDAKNGKLILFESHVHLALGNYNAAAETLSRGLQLLPRNEWGFVVQRYEHLYQGQMYVHQMRELELFLRENPNDVAAHLVRGYHYLFLGQDVAGQQALQQAVALDPGNQLATALLQSARRTEKPAAPTPIELLPTPAVPLED